MQIYSPIIIKLALGIICLIAQINIMGKGNLAPSSAMDQVQNYVLGGIIGGVIYTSSITVLQFVLVLIIWTLLVLVLKFLKEHNRYIKLVIGGKPLTLIHNGKVIVDECLKNGISASDLMMKLRANGIYEIKKVKRVILEQNGQLTLIEFGEDNIKYPLINDGQPNYDVLEIIDNDIEWLEYQVTSQGYNSLKDIYLGEYVSGEVILYGYTN